MSARRAIAAAALLAGCGYYPEVAIDLREGDVATDGLLQVCAASSGASARGCEDVAGRMAMTRFGVAGGPRQARFVFDQSTPGTVRVETFLGWADFRLPAGDVLRIPAYAPDGGAVTIDCTGPAYVCGSASRSVCQSAPAPCPPP